MPPARIPDDEDDRLRALVSLGILDTLPEPEYDDLTRLASTICGTPISLVSFVDASRQWCKSRVGLTVDETPRDISFCAHAILQDDLFIVPDAAADPRFADNPLSTGAPYIRFYAGAPLITSDGQRLGTLCVIDTIPRELTESQRESLRALARQAMAQLELRRQLRDHQRTERALLASEEWFRGLSQASPIGIFRTDINGRALYVNRRWEEITGFSDEESAGSGWEQAVHPEDRDGVTRAWQTAVRTHSLFDHIYRVVRRDGHMRVIHARATLVGEGDQEGFIGTIEDITDRHRSEVALRESEQRTRSIIDSSISGLVAMSYSGSILSANPAAERMFGYGPGELAGHHAREVFADSLSEAALIEARQSALGRISQWRLRRRNGDVFPCDVALFTFEDGGALRIAAHLMDVSERLEIEQLKNDFVSTVSHELRTPLTSIRGSLGLLAAGVMGELTEDARQLVTVAERNSVRLITLINDILDFDKLESGKMEMELQPLAMARVIERSVEAVATFAAQEGIELRAEPTDAFVLADEARFAQVLINLLSNAVKFSPAGASVIVRTTSTERGIELQVIDRGRGIPPDALGKLFQRFQQVDSSDSRRKGGTGLGLAICKAIVDQHGGTIGVDSVEGEGSTFWVRLPRVIDCGASGGTDVVKPIVLVADEGLVDELAASLRTTMCAIVVTSTMDEAESLLLRNAISVAVVDAAFADDRVWRLAGRAMQPGGDAVSFVIVGENVVVAPAQLGKNITVMIESAEADSVAAAVQRLLPVHDGDVLVIEDDTALLHVMATQLALAGVTVRKASTARSGLASICERRPALIVLDVSLPDRDGFDVVHELRKDVRYRDVPLLVYTGMDLTSADRRRLRLGPTQFLMKSRATDEELRALVLQLLERSREQAWQRERT